EGLMRWSSEGAEAPGPSLRAIAEQFSNRDEVTELPELFVAARAVIEADSDDVANRVAILHAAVSARANIGGQELGVAVVAGADEMIQSTLCDQLVASGRPVFKVASQKELLATVGRPGIDLAIVDFGTAPFADPMFLADLRTTVTFRHIPVVALTRTEGPGRGALLAHGADQVHVLPAELALVVVGAEGLARRSGRARTAQTADILTGLPTRTALESGYRQATALARRSGTPLTVALLDFDHFKSVNDNYGHVAGDEVLKRCSAIVRDRLRDSDTLVRWGGEEFAALFPATSTEEAKVALTDALARVAAEIFESADGRSFSVTFSAGVAEAKLGEPIDEPLGRADERLYHAKAAGRARVVAKSGPAMARALEVLIIDSNATSVRIMASRIRAMGATVTRASSPDEIPELMQQRRLDLVILDMELPDAQGLSVLAELQSGPQRTVPVLSLGADGSDATIAAAFALGAHDYLVKPFSPRELIARVGRLVQRPGLTPANAAAPSQGPIQHVLLVEDEASLRRIIEMSLRGTGWEITMASCGADALAVAARRQMDLILMDVAMTRIDGITTIRKLRTMPGYEHTPVIIVSGKSPEELATLTSSVKVMGVIQKPFDPLTLAERVRGMLDTEVASDPLGKSSSAIPLYSAERL
ncbi:MAG: two-component system cell cycle response regulator, partial [Myxococcota bacterium]